MFFYNWSNFLERELIILSGFLVLSELRGYSFSEDACKIMGISKEHNFSLNLDFLLISGDCVCTSKNC